MGEKQRVRVGVKQTKRQREDDEEYENSISFYVEINKDVVINDFWVQNDHITRTIPPEGRRARSFWFVLA